MIHVFITSLAFILIRFWIALSIDPAPLSVVGSFKAFAHLYVGVLIGLAICQKERWIWTVIAVMSVAEVAFAVWSRMQ